MHSAVTDAREWDSVAPLLAREHDVLTLDLPGFGARPIDPGELSLADVVLSAFAGSAALVGTSWGGRSVLEAALAAPARVSALVLVNANTFEWSDEVRAIGEEEDALVDAGRFDDAAALMVRWWLVGPQRELADVDPALRARVHEMQRHAYELQSEVEVTVRRVELELARVGCPVLVVRGALDWPHVERAAERYVAELPDAREVVIDAAAHLPALEQPDRFGDAVGEFLRSLDP